MRRKTGFIIVLLAVAGIAAAVVAARLRAAPEAGRSNPGAGAPGGNPAARVVPVIAAPVAERDVPIYLDGLGNVAAYRTVVVKSQVDGRLNEVLFREGQEVRRGEVLAQIDPRPFQIQLNQAEGALARDKALLESGRRNLERFTTLREQKLIAQQQEDDQRAAVGQLEGAVRIDEAQIESAKLNLEYARIVSPIDGITGVRQVDPGNLVHATDQNGIVLITQLDPIAVLFTLPAENLTRVAEEMRNGPLRVDAYSQDGATLLATGKLELIDNQINVNTATMRLKAIFPNPKRLLWPNQFVKTRLLLTTRKNAVVVPSQAVQRGPKGLFVYVIKLDQTVEARPVEVALTQGEVTLLQSGVKPGEQVVTDGQNQLRPDSKVQLRSGDRTGPPSGAAPSPGAPPSSNAAPPAGAGAMPGASPAPGPAGSRS